MLVMYANSHSPVYYLLALLRALGDLKYKQVVQYAREHQVLGNPP